MLIIHYNIQINISHSINKCNNNVLYILILKNLYSYIKYQLTVKLGI